MRLWHHCATQLVSAKFGFYLASIWPKGTKWRRYPNVLYLTMISKLRGCANHIQKTFYSVHFSIIKCLFLMCSVKGTSQTQPCSEPAPVCSGLLLEEDPAHVKQQQFSQPALTRRPRCRGALHLYQLCPVPFNPPDSSGNQGDILFVTQLERLFLGLLASSVKKREIQMSAKDI